jgi:hypothetical protein
MTKASPKAVGDYDDRMHGDNGAINVSKSYLTYNASTCDSELKRTLILWNPYNITFNNEI